MPTATLDQKLLRALPEKLEPQLQRLTERIIWAVLFCAAAGFGASHVANVLGAENYYPAVLIAILFLALFATPAIFFTVLAFRSLDEIRKTVLKSS